MNADKLKALLQVVDKIPMFRDLSRQDAASILQACEFKSVKKGATLCQIRQPSEDLSILLSGELTIHNEAGVEIVKVALVSPVGEMAVHRPTTIRHGSLFSRLELAGVEEGRLRAPDEAERGDQPQCQPQYHSRSTPTAFRWSRSERRRPGLAALEAKLESRRQETKKLQGVVGAGEE